jgi:hypothetical protein
MVHYLNDICGIDKARKLYNLTKLSIFNYNDGIYGLIPPLLYITDGKENKLDRS